MVYSQKGFGRYQLNLPEQQPRRAHPPWSRSPDAASRTSAAAAFRSASAEGPARTAPPRSFHLRPRQAPQRPPAPPSPGVQGSPAARSAITSRIRLQRAATAGASPTSLPSARAPATSSFRCGPAPASLSVGRGRRGSANGAASPLRRATPQQSPRRGCPRSTPVRTGGEMRETKSLELRRA